MKNFLIIGGAGIIGKPAVYKALENGFQVTTINNILDTNLPPTVKQVVVDKHDKTKFAQACTELNRDIVWDVVFDIYNLGKEDAKTTYQNLYRNAKHFIIISTTLVYDRSKPSTELIKSSHPLSEIGILGGYADHKIELEHFWHSITDVPWTILRPYHIVGAGSLLGCVPDENRDPKLLTKIKNRESLVLCEGGRIPFNYIHPEDIAEIVIRSANNTKAYFKAYNAVNPTIITGKEYFEIIGSILGKEIQIINKPMQQVWDESEGWELTTLPHIYDANDLKSDIGYVPSTPLENALKTAIENYPNTEQSRSEIPVHQRMTLKPHPKKITWLLE